LASSEKQGLSEKRGKHQLHGGGDLFSPSGPLRKGNLGRGRQSVLLEAGNPFSTPPLGPLFFLLLLFFLFQNEDLVFYKKFIFCS
jgi:hypothetical protein